ncbi:MAG: hypothetical protein JXB13_01530 [Phycisphaerae bacterium]|nr:hypothetical protein [Phycisphaerae bacterium]
MAGGRRGILRGWRRRRPALTLFEVVAALVLLATVVSALLVAQGRALQQLAELRERDQAARLVRELLVQWELAREDVTQPAEGTFPDAADWVWSRTVQPQAVGMHDDWVRIRVVASPRDRVSDPVAAVAYEWLVPPAESVPAAPGRDTSLAGRTTQ